MKGWTLNVTPERKVNPESRGCLVPLIQQNKKNSITTFPVCVNFLQQLRNEGVRARARPCI